MVGDSRRSRRVENWQNVKKLFQYKPLINEKIVFVKKIKSPNKLASKINKKFKGMGSKTLWKPR